MFKVQRLKRGDEKLGDAICESLKTAYDPEISRFFVHQDAGYKRFFNFILDHPSYATYYSFDSESGELHGFVCFQIIENNLFLKHIVVDNRVRGSKIGTKLLSFALKDIQEKSEKAYELLQLHVFEKNSKALSWYLSIGMEIIDCTYWYDLSPILNVHLTETGDQKPLISVCHDTFGFLQVSYGDVNIGTLLAKKALIIKNPKALEYFAVLAPFVRQYKVESVGFTSNTPYNDFDLVDKSLLMSTPIRTMELV